MSKKLATAFVIASSILFAGSASAEDVVIEVQTHEIQTKCDFSKQIVKLDKANTMGIQKYYCVKK